MAKGKLIYDLTDPDDAREHLCAVKSGEIAIVLWQIAHNLKKSCHLEAEGAEKDFDTYDAIEMVFDKIYELMDENGIVIDDLTN